MRRPTKENENNLPKTESIIPKKINYMFKASILKSILKILTMDHAGFRSLKSVKNINRLFNSLNMAKYENKEELKDYIWLICFISKQWLTGIINLDLILEGARRSPEYDSKKENIITSCINDPNIITAPEAKMIFKLIGEALQFGYITSLKDKYIQLLDDIKLDNPEGFRKLVNRLFEVSQSLLDIKHNTNLVANKVTFNTADDDSIKEAVSQTIDSLDSSCNIFKTGIQRLNTLLSPGYMNGRIYVFIGLPGGGKSYMLLKSALDIRKYNPNYQTKTPGMKPCILYITMENSFTETIERVWNMSFDDSISNYTKDEAIEKLSCELGIGYSDKEEIHIKKGKNKISDLLEDNVNEKSNIEIVIKYFSYREINTDDLYSIIQDLRDENLEVCVLILDYIKRIKPSTISVDNVKLELSRIINELKALAVIMDIPVITAHQMNRIAASVVDSASRSGQGDVTKLVGREHIGDAWEVCESADFAAVLNIEYKPNTDQKYMVISLVKRRSIDTTESKYAKYTYLAHPFSKTNGFRLLDDMNLKKELSVQSLVTDILAIGKEKTNAVPRLKSVEPSEFEESKDT